MGDKLHFTPFKLTGRNVVRHFDRPAVMGILNVTPDSFYDGGRYTNPDTILTHARQLLADGADIIDVGAVSSRPGAQLLEPDEEASRLAPIVALECTVTGGRTLQAYKRGGKEEARERARIQWEEKKKRKAKLRSRIYIALCFFIIIFSPYL